MTSYLLRASIAGAASGLRSTAGIAALIEAKDSGLPAPVRGQLAMAGAAIAVGVELVVDKLPNTPSRLSAVGLGGRLAFAGLAGAVIARNATRSVIPAVVVGSAAALVAAKIGYRARAAAARRLPALVAAGAEDALAVGLATAAARMR